MNEIHQEDLREIASKLTDMILINLSEYIECRKQNEAMADDTIYRDIFKILEIYFDYPYSRKEDY